eukprot:PhF_6_TR7829/c0_g1_i1/m.11318
MDTQTEQGMMTTAYVTVVNWIFAVLENTLYSQVHYLNEVHGCGITLENSIREEFHSLLACFLRYQITNSCDRSYVSHFIQALCMRWDTADVDSLMRHNVPKILLEMTNTLTGTTLERCYFASRDEIRGNSVGSNSNGVTSHVMQSNGLNVEFKINTVVCLQHGWTVRGSSRSFIDYVEFRCVGQKRYYFGWLDSRKKPEKRNLSIWYQDDAITQERKEIKTLNCNHASAVVGLGMTMDNRMFITLNGIMLYLSETFGDEDVESIYVPCFGVDDWSSTANVIVNCGTHPFLFDRRWLHASSVGPKADVLSLFPYMNHYLLCNCIASWSAETPVVLQHVQTAIESLVSRVTSNQARDFSECHLASLHVLTRVASNMYPQIVGLMHSTLLECVTKKWMVVDEAEKPNTTHNNVVVYEGDDDEVSNVHNKGRNERFILQSRCCELLANSLDSEMGFRGSGGEAHIVSMLDALQEPTEIASESADTKSWFHSVRKPIEWVPCSYDLVDIKNESYENDADYVHNSIVQAMETNAANNNEVLCRGSVLSDDEKIISFEITREDTSGYVGICDANFQGRYANVFEDFPHDDAKYKDCVWVISEDEYNLPSYISQEYRTASDEQEFEKLLFQLNRERQELIVTFSTGFTIVAFRHPKFGHNNVPLCPIVQLSNGTKSQLKTLKSTSSVMHSQLYRLPSLRLCVLNELAVIARKWLPRNVIQQLVKQASGGAGSEKAHLALTRVLGLSKENGMFAITNNTGGSDMERVQIVSLPLSDRTIRARSVAKNIHVTVPVSSLVLSPLAIDVQDVVIRYGEDNVSMFLAALSSRLNAFCPAVALDRIQSREYKRLISEEQESWNHILSIERMAEFQVSYRLAQKELEPAITDLCDSLTWSTLAIQRHHPNVYMPLEQHNRLIKLYRLDENYMTVFSEQALPLDRNWSVTLTVAPSNQYNKEIYLGFIGPEYTVSTDIIPKSKKEMKTFVTTAPNVFLLPMGRSGYDLTPTSYNAKRSGEVCSEDHDKMFTFTWKYDAQSREVVYHVGGDLQLTESAFTFREGIAKLHLFVVATYTHVEIQPMVPRSTCSFDIVAHENGSPGTCSGCSQGTAEVLCACCRASMCVSCMGYDPRVVHHVFRVCHQSCLPVRNCWRIRNREIQKGSRVFVPYVDRFLQFSPVMRKGKSQWTSDPIVLSASPTLDNVVARFIISSGQVKQVGILSTEQYQVELSCQFTVNNNLVCVRLSDDELRSRAGRLVAFVVETTSDAVINPPRSDGLTLAEIVDVRGNGSAVQVKLLHILPPQQTRWYPKLSLVPVVNPVHENGGYGDADVETDLDECEKVDMFYDLEPGRVVLQHRPGLIKVSRTDDKRFDLHTSSCDEDTSPDSNFVTDAIAESIQQCAISIRVLLLYSSLITPSMATSLLRVVLSLELADCTLDVPSMQDIDSVTWYPTMRSPETLHFLCKHLHLVLLQRIPPNELTVQSLLAGLQFCTKLTSHIASVRECIPDAMMSQILAKCQQIIVKHEEHSVGMFQTALSLISFRYDGQVLLSLLEAAMVVRGSTTSITSYIALLTTIQSMLRQAPRDIESDDLSQKLYNVVWNISVASSCTTLGEKVAYLEMEVLLEIGAKFSHVVQPAPITTGTAAAENTQGTIGKTFDALLSFSKLVNAVDPIGFLKTPPASLSPLLSNLEKSMKKSEDNDDDGDDNGGNNADEDFVKKLTEFIMDYVTTNEWSRYGDIPQGKFTQGIQRLTSVFPFLESIRTRIIDEWTVKIIAAADDIHPMDVPIDFRITMTEFPRSYDEALRQSVLHQVVTKLSGSSQTHRASRMFHVIHEDGTDAGGLYNNALTSIGEEVMLQPYEAYPNTIPGTTSVSQKHWCGLFTQTGGFHSKDKTVMPAVTGPSRDVCLSVEGLAMYEGLGRLLAGAFLQPNITIPVDFPVFFWKFMVEDKLTFEDYKASIDPDVDLAMLALCPEDDLEESYPGCSKTLAEGGKLEDHLLHLYDVPLQHIRAGMRYVIPQSILCLLSHATFAKGVAGVPEITFPQLKDSINFSASSPEEMKKWVLNVLKKFSNEERCLFVRFCTGLRRFPLPAKIEVSFTPMVGLPIAHTCSSSIEISRATSSVDELAKKLKMAIRECTDFGFA